MENESDNVYAYIYKTSKHQIFVIHLTLLKKRAF